MQKISNHLEIYTNDIFISALLAMQDLQACIYLLERHIDLQQEIIQGLTNLQELHKYGSAFSWNFK